MNRDMLEILIGKYLDSEISPAEQRLLDQELSNNPEARDLLEAWRAIDEAAGEAFAGCAPEAAADDVFEKAWQRAKRNRIGKTVRQSWAAWGRWAALVAIGFGLGLLAYNVTFTPTEEAPVAAGADSGADIAVVADKPEDNDETAVVVAEGDESETPERITPAEAARRERLARLQGEGRQDPGYYSYTDPSGGEWLIEGYRNDELRSVGYGGDL